MELADGNEIWVNTEEETEEDKFNAYLFIDKQHRGNLIGIYDSENETMNKI